jgi:glycosyltransferase involved in cell wall biosynthesis
VHPATDIRIFHKECKSLAAAGYKVTLLAANTQSRYIDNVNIVSVNLPGTRLLRMIFATFKMYVAAMQQKARIYHFHDPELMLCGAMLRLSGKKVIYDIHENVRLTILDKQYLKPWLRKTLYWLYYAYEKMLLPFFNRLVLALSEETYKKYYPAKKSTVILNFPLPLKKKIIEKTFDTNTFRLVYAGVVHEYRGIFEMLNIAKHLKQNKVNFIFDIIGFVRPQSLNNDINIFIEKENLTDNVKLHGFVDAAEIPQYLAKADVGISLLTPFLRYKEALPTKIFEYMQHGLPVVTNNFDLLIDYVERTQTGICIDIDNLKSDINKITDLLENKDLLQQMSKNGIKLTAEKWNWSTQEKRLVQLYNSLNL